MKHPLFLLILLLFFPTGTMIAADGGTALPAFPGACGVFADGLCDPAADEACALSVAGAGAGAVDQGYRGQGRIPESAVFFQRVPALLGNVPARVPEKERRRAGKRSRRIISPGYLKSVHCVVY